MSLPKLVTHPHARYNFAFFLTLRWQTQIMQVIRLSVISILISFLSTVPSFAFTVNGEVYSESTYVPEYGVLTESQLRLIPYKNDRLTTYVGAAGQLQTKTQDSQSKLYDKSLVMAIVGGRYRITDMLSVLAEYRSEERSRFGIFAGHMWQYNVFQQPVFTEFYGESMILPSFHNDPISTLWVKQGVRYSLAENVLLDPFIEAYLRRSPTPDLGRDTEQLRAGVRAIYLVKTWSFSLLAYQSFPKDEKPHEEVLFVFGGSF